MRLGLEPPSEPWLWLPAAAAAAAFAWHAARTPARRGLVALRAAAAAGLALAVLRPGLAVRREELAKPRLLILVDAGHSMAGKAPGGGTRLAQAAAWLERHRAEIERRADATVALVSDRAETLGGLGALGQARTRPTGFRAEDALADAAPERAPARVWLVSDGVVEGGEGLGRALGALGAPLDALGVGPARREPGAVFTDLRAPDFAFLHGRIPVEATVEASGVAGKTVELVLERADDEAPGGWRELGRQSRRANGDLESFSARFDAEADRLGAARFRLSASGGGRRRTREFRVETMRQKYRIMYLAGRPSPEYAFLREYLKADPNRELVSFVILRNPENPSPAPDRELSLIPFPVDQIFGRALPQFDLFILENFSAARFRLPPQHLEALKRFVAGGGALLVKGGESAFAAGGYRGSPLEEALPVVLSGRSPDFVPGLFKARPGPPEHPLVRLYETPQDSARAWEALPPLDGWGRFASVRPGATVLAWHPKETTDDGKPLPVAVTRSYGRGKVMLVSTDSTWRWRLGAAADPDAAGFYARFWSRAVQYLTGSLDLSKVKFAPLPDRVPPREPARLSLRVFDEGFGPAPAADVRLTVSWTGPGGRPVEVAARETEPGVYAVELTGLSPGPQRVRASARLRGKPWGEDEVRFSWEQPQEEPMDRGWLAKAAAAGGGRFADLADAAPGPLLDALPPPAPRPETLRRLRPFGAPAWLALCAALLLAEWALRRRAGHA